MCTTCMAFGLSKFLEEFLCASLDRNELLNQLHDEIKKLRMMMEADCSKGNEEKGNGM